MTAMWVITSKRDKLGRKRWHWNLVAANGEIIATSEVYNSAGAALRGVVAVRRHAPHARLLKRDDTGLERPRAET